MRSKDGRKLWRVEVVRVMYVLADKELLAREVAARQLDHHNSEEIAQLSVREADLETAVREGWENAIPYGFGEDSIREIALQARKPDDEKRADRSTTPG